MNKQRKFSLTTRYVVIVGLLLFAANIVLGIVMFNQSKNGMRTMIRKNMLDLVNTAAGLLDGDVMGALTEDDVGGPVFRDIADKLIVFQNNADIEFIYAVKEDGPDHYVFTVDPDPVDPGQFGEEIVVTDALIAAADGVAAVDDFNASADHPEAALSISMGAAAFRAGEDSTFREVFTRADDAMYKNKGEHHRRMPAWRDRAESAGEQGS